MKRTTDKAIGRLLAKALEEGHITSEQFEATRETFADIAMGYGMEVGMGSFMQGQRKIAEDHRDLADRIKMQIEEEGNRVTPFSHTTSHSTS